MSNFHIIVSTHKQNEREEFYKNVQLKEKELSIGWGLVNPVNKSSFEIKKLIEVFYPDKKGTVNPDNGEKSLISFTHLHPGDFIFVRGNAKIIDVVIITGYAFFDKEGHYQNDYFLKIPFRPLFEDRLSYINTADIPEEIYKEILYEGGRSLVIREISDMNARALMKAMSINF